MNDPSHSLSGRDSADSRDLVYLFYPPLEHGRVLHKDNPDCMPLSVLVIAGLLEDAGFRCELFDLRDPEVVRTWPEKVRQTRDRAIAAGISISFTSQTTGGLDAAKVLRQIAPELPLVWGGWHAMALDEETARCPQVHIVSRALAEMNAVQLMQALRNGDPLEQVPAITFRNQTGEIVRTPDAPLPRRLPPVPVPYERLDAEKYELSLGRANIFSSRGCPLRCRFCMTAKCFDGHWVARDTTEVLDEIQNLYQKHGVDRFAFFDSNFFVDSKRVEDICNGLLERGLKVTWGATANVRVLAKMSSELIALIRRAGCTLIETGFESGSPRILEKLRKGYTLADCDKALDRLEEARIPLRANFIVGLPEETREDLAYTYRLARQVAERVPDCRQSYFMYFPYPSTELYQQEIDQGIKIDFPDTLEGWAYNAKFVPTRFDPPSPWYNKSPVFRRYRKRKDATLAGFYMWLSFKKLKHGAKANRHPVLKFAMPALRRIAHWRSTRGAYQLPWEWWAYRARALVRERKVSIS